MLVLVLVPAALAAPAGAVVAVTSTDAISGYEYYATSTDGYFAGKATGDLPGSWNTHVVHAPLSLSATPSATITGGSVQLVTGYRLLLGAFTGGTVQVTDAGAGCTNQTFDVDGTLGQVGPWWNRTGTGTFAATLTHYRRSILGRCVTYAASVAGEISLSS